MENVRLPNQCPTCNQRDANYKLSTIFQLLSVAGADIFQTADGTEVARPINDHWVLIRYNTDSTDQPHGFRIMATELFTRQPHYHDTLVSAARAEQGMAMDLESLCSDIHGAIDD
jgi:hypothetical protein